MCTDKYANVMVVDDEPAVCEMLVDALDSKSLHVTTASSGKEAIDLAKLNHPDLLIADLRLSDCNGLDVIDSLRDIAGDIPAVVITGQDNTDALAEASRRRPVELMTKPLNIERLRATVREELSRRVKHDRTCRRTRRLRRLARASNLERKKIRQELDSTCADLAAAYRSLSGQLAMQKLVLSYQRDLIGAKNDDDVFCILFRLFVQRSGSVFGVSMVCDADARLRIAGRFGVPHPDSMGFCEALTEPLVDAALANPQCMLIDAGQEAEMFSQSIRKYLAGLSILTIPLIPVPGEMIGLVLLYRKGEQPFTDGDVALAEMIAPPTAVAIRRND